MSMKLAYKTFDLPLKHVFTIARGSTTVQPTLIVQLSQDERHGYGEATTNTYYGATAAQMASALESVRSTIESADPLAPDNLLDELADHLQGNEFALAAIDQAVHDLWGKLQGQPVYKLWGLTTDRIPVSDYTIGIDSVDNMIAKLREMPDWPVYKIKLGTDDDLSIVRALREATDATLRVDANCGWTPEQAIHLSGPLKSLGVEFIEQPLPADDVDGAAEVFHRSALPIIADESCARESDVSRCVGRFHGVNIKLVKCGGLAPARRMIGEARSHGLRVMAGCMTESTVSISALAQLLPQLDYVDMDGAVLLAQDIARGVSVEKGVCEFPAAAGTGVELLDGPLPDDCREIETSGTQNPETSP